MNSISLFSGLQKPPSMAARQTAMAQPLTVAEVPTAASRADDTLRRALLQRLSCEAGWDAATTNVFVDRGNVVVQGLLGGPSRRRVRRIAWLQPDVRAVWDARVRARE